MPAQVVGCTADGSSTETRFSQLPTAVSYKYPSVSLVHSQFSAMLSPRFLTAAEFGKRRSVFSCVCSPAQPGPRGLGHSARSALISVLPSLSELQPLPLFTL